MHRVNTSSLTLTTLVRSHKIQGKVTLGNTALAYSIVEGIFSRAQGSYSTFFKQKETLRDLILDEQTFFFYQ